MAFTNTPPDQTSSTPDSPKDPSRRNFTKNALAILGATTFAPLAVAKQLEQSETSETPETFGLESKQLLESLATLQLGVRINTSGKIEFFDENGKTVALSLDETNSAEINGESFAKNNQLETIAQRTAVLKLVVWQQSQAFDTRVTEWQNKDPEVAGAMEQFREKFNYFVNNIDGWSDELRPARAGARIIRFYNRLRQTGVQVPHSLTNFDAKLNTYLQNLTPEQISELYQTPIKSDPSLSTGNFLNLDIRKHWEQVFAKLSGEQGFEVNNALLAETLWYRYSDWIQSVNGWIADDNMSFGDYENESTDIKKDIKVFEK